MRKTPEALERIADALEQFVIHIDSLERLVEAIVPTPPQVVGTPYVAQRLGCTTVWVAELVRTGELPSSCVVAGTGHGKPWKFHRSKVDQWLEHR